MYLRITVKENAQNVLAGFPFQDEQYLDQEYYTEDAPGVLIVNLGNVEDTTPAQNQHLNTNNDILSYKVG